MGASRKLQGEIDRVLKKVQEGVDVFESIWNKVYDTENANQKEKFEADLKKEIKKLQRYRDQIKTWIQSSEIKDKKALMDARKQIEREMERFKVCEKETKTKAFSKEGLVQQPKTDPKEKAKSETRDWLNSAVGDLESQIDNFEAEIEALSVKKGKARPPRLTHLEASITRHKAHIMKLELILRLLDNDGLSPEQVNDVKDFIDDYVERNQDDFDEFSDVDELYSSLPLDKVETLEDLVSIGTSVLVKGVGSVSTASAGLGVKNSLATSPNQTAAPLSSSATQNMPVQDQAEDTFSIDINSDAIPRTPSSKTEFAGTFASTASSSIGSVLVASPIPAATASNAAIRSSTDGQSAVLSGPGSVRAVADNSVVVTSSVMSTPDSVKDDNNTNLPSRRASPAPSDISRGIGRGSLNAGVSNQTSSIPMGFGSVNAISGVGALGAVPVISDIPKRNMVVADEKIGTGSLSQPLASPLNSRIVPQQIPKTGDVVGSSDVINTVDGVTLGGRVFPSVGGVQWRSQSADSFQNPNETGQFRGRAEIAPDQREKFLQRFQQVQQQGPSNLINMSQFSSTNQKQFSSQQQSPLLQQPSAAECAQLPRDSDLSPGQPLQISQSSGNLGVIGRRSIADLGAIGDATSCLAGNSGGSHDQIYNLQMLESAYYKLPSPKDSERAKKYIPRHPAITPATYPQLQAPIFENPAFWERLSLDVSGPDTLFFAFYYQQNTYQQYLAARELKRQSWRYHRKYNTWFQRHEEPNITNEDYEQGAYVYFDFHVNEDSHGWCQRIKNDFTFEYSFLEDELAV